MLAGGLLYDQASDRVVVPHDDALSLTEELTIAAWIRNDDPGYGGYYRILSKESGAGNDDYWFSAFAGGELAFGLGGTTYTSSGLSMQTGTWYHVAVTFDDAANEARLYVDGVLHLSYPTGATITSKGADLIIGSNFEDKTWDGLLDDVRLYERVLTLSEIEEIVNASGGGGGGPDPPPGPSTRTFRDTFVARIFTGSDGPDDWATDWLEINESDGPTKGDTRIHAHLQDGNVLQIQDSDGGGEGVQREADLSSCTSAQLEFTYRRADLDDDNDYVSVSASDDGGASWVILATYGGLHDDSSPQPSGPLDITSYIASDTRIRFLSSPDLGNQDKVYFDDIEIEAGGCETP